MVTTWSYDTFIQRTYAARFQDVIQTIGDPASAMRHTLSWSRSQCHNSGQAVVQVLSSDTMDTMLYASNMTELEFKRLLKTTSCDDNEVVVKTGAESGRSQAICRREAGGVD